MFKDLVRPALTVFLAISAVTGIVYPLAVTGVAQLIFPRQAAGSLIEKDGRLVGSALLAQPFTSPGYFWSRPSAISPTPYDATNSAGSNLGPTNPALVDAVKDRVAKLRAAHPTESGPVPADLATASASGLDPHLSPAGVYYQVKRVAAARGLDPAALRALVDRHVEGPQWGLFGEPRVNVLLLNLDLDVVKPLAPVAPAAAHAAGSPS